MYSDDYCSSRRNFDKTSDERNSAPNLTRLIGKHAKVSKPHRCEKKKHPRQATGAKSLLEEISMEAACLPEAVTKFNPSQCHP